MNRYLRLAACFVVAVILSVPALGVSGQQQTLPPWRAGFPEARETAVITVGETPVEVDLALAPEQQQLGLGYRNSLEPGTGMLFVFPESSEQSFWMKGMRFCLDIIWIEDGRITGAAESVCPDPRGTPDLERQHFLSGGPVSHVLEMPAGWLGANGYGAGTPVTLPDGIS